MSNTLRITGMASGLDVDSIVKQMMTAENTKLDKIKQDKQILQWKQDLCRDIIGDISSFKLSFLNVTKADTNMLSINNYAGFDVTTSDGGTTPSTIIYATALAGADTGVYSVKVNKIAKAAVISSDVINQIADVTKSTKLSELGMTDASGDIKFTYNGTSDSITITKDSSINDVINAINLKTSGNVTAKYSELTKTFTFQTSATGSTKSFSIDAGGSAQVLSALKLTQQSASGQDAEVEITPPGAASATTVTKSTNNFTIDNINYNILNQSATTATINVTSNAQKTFDKIKNCIDKYNDLISKITGKIEEKKQYTYKPLTDDQKKDMKDDEIKNWEDKAKEGLLSYDSNLQSMVYQLRNAFCNAVEGAGVTLSEIGLSTSSDISQRGKIIIDEDKLKAAIQTKGQQIQNLFTKVSTSQPAYSPDMNTANRTIRTNEEGIFQRVNDILNDYTRTTRNSSGKKGALLEVAGIKGDMSEVNNILTGQMLTKDKLIIDIQKKISTKEDMYYAKYSKLESAMQKANSQSSWLSQQFVSN